MAELLGTSKESFIASVRQSLGRTGGEPDERYAPLQEDLSSLEERASNTLERLKKDRGRLVEELARVAELQGWKVCQAANSEEALGYIRELVQESSAKLVVRSDQEIFRQMPVDELLEGMGAQVQVMARGQSGNGEFDPASADLGITGVDYAIAETGTAVLLPRKGISRLVSLLPPVHLALVRSSEVLESLDDLYLLRRLEYHRNGGDMGSYMNFITGPSRTADIEQTLVIGAHGPRETHMVILVQE